MKRLSLLFVFINLYLGANLFAQDFVTAREFYSCWNNPDTSFFVIDSLASIYFEDAENDSLLKREHKYYSRWAVFAESRIDSAGTLRTMRNKNFEHLRSNGANNGCSTTHQNQWTALGPFSPVRPQGTGPQVAAWGVGLINCIAIDRTDPSLNTILVGSDMGGLFKTTNRGETWTNITESIEAPAFGVLSVAIHPSNPDIIIITTGTGWAIPGYIDRHSIGVWRTTDG